MIFSINAANETKLVDEIPGATPIPVGEGTVVITSSKELTQTTLEWPYVRLVEVWNKLAPHVGLKQVAKFENRTKAIVRIWRAVELLAEKAAGTDTTETLHKLQDQGAERAGRRECAKAIREQAAAVEAPAEIAACAAPAKGKKKAAKTPRLAKERKPKAAKQAKPAGEPKVPREGSAKAKVIEMISRKGGATLEEICEATGWQKHTVRGFMSTLERKGGPAVTSSRRESDKARVYEAGR